MKPFEKRITTVGDGIGIHIPKWQREAYGYYKGQKVRVIIEPLETTPPESAVRDLYTLLAENPPSVIGKFTGADGQDILTDTGGPPPTTVGEG